MLHTNDQKPVIENKEDEFYLAFLDDAIGFATGAKKVDGVKFRQMVSAAGVVAKQRQTRGAMKALDYQIERDTGRGLLAKKTINAVESGL